MSRSQESSSSVTESTETSYSEQEPPSHRLLGANNNAQRLEEVQIKSHIHEKLIQSGEKDRLKEMLRTRLIECGWRDEIKAICKDIIRSKGLEKITVQDLVAELTPRGRAMVPENVKAELLQKISLFLASNEAV